MFFSIFSGVLIEKKSDYFERTENGKQQIKKEEKKRKNTSDAKE